MEVLGAAEWIQGTLKRVGSHTTKYMYKWCLTLSDTLGLKAKRFLSLTAGDDIDVRSPRSTTTSTVILQVPEHLMPNIPQYLQAIFAWT